MTFVRLAGCNAPELELGCTAWCDTAGGWDPGAGEELTVDEVVGRVHLPRLCLTGGEPLLQIDGLCELIEIAQGRGIRVHLETNGTVDPLAPLPEPASAPNGIQGLQGGAGAAAALGFDWAVVSPKPPDYIDRPGVGRPSG